MLAFRITYQRYGDLRDDEKQMARGGVLVRVPVTAPLVPDTPAALELVLPDGRALVAVVKILQVIEGHGVAVTVTPEIVEQVRHATGIDRGTAPACHEWGEPRPDPPVEPPYPRAATRPPFPRASTRPPIRAATQPPADERRVSIRAASPPIEDERPVPRVPPRAASPPIEDERPVPRVPPRASSPPIESDRPVRPPTERNETAAMEPTDPGERSQRATAQSPAELTHAAKIQLALHGNRDQRNAILRDPNRTLYPYVLKNPQITIEDILAMAKNTQMSPDVLKMIADRSEWFQRPQIATALARNPKTPQDVAVRALDYVPLDMLRQFAKGTGALPHVAQAARKKVIK